MKKAAVYLAIVFVVSCGVLQTPEDRLYDMSKKALIKGLKRPDGVEFDKSEHRVLIYDNGGTCAAEVYASFKGYNFFGVKEKHYYKAEYICLKADPKVHDENSWELRDIKLDEEIEAASSTGKKSSISDIELIKYSEGSSEYGYRYVYARVKNNSAQLATVSITATFYDDNGKIVGTAKGIESNISAGAERTIRAIGSDIEGATRYQVEITDAYFE